jgi:hypothetical protein
MFPFRRANYEDIHIGYCTGLRIVVLGLKKEFANFNIPLPFTCVYHLAQPVKVRFVFFTFKYTYLYVISHFLLILTCSSVFYIFTHLNILSSMLHLAISNSYVIFSCLSLVRISANALSRCTFVLL